MEPKYTYRFPPCPVYDVETMESWLEELARRGLLLSRGGSFCGFVELEKTTPTAMRYRTQPLKKQGLFEDRDVEEEVVEMAGEYGWSYLCRIGEYGVFATGDPAARELHTDPRVQAVSMAALHRRKRNSVLSSSVLLLLAMALIIWSGPVSFLIQNDLHFFWAVIPLWIVGAVLDIRELRWLRRTREKLSLGEHLARDKNWRVHCWQHRISAVCAVLLIAFFYGSWLSQSLLDWEDRRWEPLTEASEVPFATMEDLGDGTLQPDNLISRSNHLAQRTTVLADRQVKLCQSGRVLRDGVCTLSGTLDVEYYELRSTWLARELFRELKQQALRKDGVTAAETPQLPAEQEYAYIDYFPTLLLQDGSRVLRARLVQYSDSPGCELAQWADRIAESIQE